MDFVKKHYEKVILSIVLLGVVGALVALPFVIQKDKEEMDQMTEVVSPKPKILPPLDLSAQKNVLVRMQNPEVPDFATTNKVFNPVTWKKNDAGELIKITTGHEIDASAAVVTNIIPLYLVLSLDSVETNVGVRYVIGVERQASTSKTLQHHQTRYASLGEKNDLFTITKAKGDPQAPDELTLKLADSGESVTIAKGKPFQRADDYKADIVFEPQKKSFLNRRNGDVLVFGGDQYNIVAINQNEVILAAKSNQKKTILQYSR